jgi:hypothetical protein
MKDLKGFKDFIEQELQPVYSGDAELARLEDRHYLFSLKLNHQDATALMSGRYLPPKLGSPTSLSQIHKEFANLNSATDTIMIMAFPKRWENQLGKNTFHLFGEMIGEIQQAHNYIWGTYSLWNPRIEDFDQGNFFRNPHYHANDGLLNKWLEKHPVPQIEKKAVPLNQAPRVMGFDLLNQGRHSFHGYSGT